MELKLAVPLVVTRRGLADVRTRVAHVPEKIALGILRPKTLEVGSDAQVGDCCLLHRVVVHVESSEEDKAERQQLSGNALQPRAQGRQRKP